MWQVIDIAREAGWSFDRTEDRAWCPDHAEDAYVPGLTWVVGCYTCDFEEEFDSEEDAKYEYNQHECEADTWIWDPEKVADIAKRRTAKRAVQTAKVNATLSEVAAKQERLEEFATRWLRIRNFFLFWKKITIEGTSDS